MTVPRSWELSTPGPFGYFPLQMAFPDTSHVFAKISWVSTHCCVQLAETPGERERQLDCTPGGLICAAAAYMSDSGKEEADHGPVYRVIFATSVSTVCTRVFSFPEQFKAVGPHTTSS